MHRAATTEVRIFNWLKDGRGQGHGRHYKPFIQVTRQDHASIGQSSILPNQFIGRQHHLLSTLERQVCLQNLAQSAVIDLREQYPMWPFEHANPLAELFEYRHTPWPCTEPSTSTGTVALAKEMGFCHQKFVGLKIPYIYTADQLVTIHLPNQHPTLVAISVKYWSDVRPKKVRRKLFRKFRFERQYWRSLGIPWLLLTERNVNVQVCANLEWALSGAIQRLQPGDIGLLDRFVRAFRAAQWGGTCIDIVHVLSLHLEVNVQTTIRILKLSIWRNLISVDRAQPIDLQTPLPRVHGKPTAIDTWSPLKKWGVQS